jgi:regulator of sigma E protease
MMGELLSSVFFFIVAIGVLVTFHEYGHYAVARRLGVKVLRFSVGFGKPLWGVRRGADRTEFVVAAVPLGGYVQMLDEREGPVPEHERHRAFNRQSLGRRTAIIAAGPAFNFLLAIAAYWLVFVIGIAGVKPVVGEVFDGSIAADGGFRTGDLIMRIDDREVSTWSAAFLVLLDKSLARDRVPVAVIDADERPRERVLDFGALAADTDRADLLENIGFSMYRPVIPAVVGKIEAGGAADRAGLRPEDRVIAVDGDAVETWEEWVEVVRRHPERELAVTIERDGRTLVLELRPSRVRTEHGDIGRIGAAVHLSEEFLESMRATERYGVGAGFVAALQRTWDMTRLTVSIVVNMVTGNVALSNLGGPVRIAQFAGASADAGLVQFISFLALISISLGVLNLLPIPILDGGHLLYNLIELVKGSPLSDRAQAIGQQIGIFMLIGLMALAVYNDILHLSG